MAFIIQKGYIRTGTNYSRVVLENNFNCLVITAEKHDDKEGVCENTQTLVEQVKRHKGWPYKITPETIDIARQNNLLKYIVCIRNPFSWFHGALKLGRTRHCPDPSDPWQVIENYNTRYKSWLNIIEENKNCSFIVKHEEIVDNFNSTMKMVHEKFDLEMKHDKYINEKRDVLAQHKGKKRISNNQYNRKQNFYKMPLNKDNAPAIDIKTFNMIRDKIDWDIMKFYGYSCYNKSYEELYK